METPCIVWKGYTRNGYGVTTVDRKQVYVHRAVMAQIVGWDGIDGREVMHLCDNPPCYRLDHLRVGTHHENLIDMLDKGRLRNGRERDHCLHGHPYDEANTYYRKDRPGHRECRTCRRQTVARHRGGQ